MLNTDIYIYIYFSLWRNKIQPSSLPWILYSRWQPPSHLFSVALDFALTYLYDTCSVTNIPRGALGTRVNLDTCRHANLTMDTCGRGNFWIRKEVVADSKIPRYVWRGPGWTNWMVCHQVSRFWVVFKQMTKLHKEPIRLRYINAKCTNDTYVKTLPKRMAVAIFRDTRQRTVFSKTTKVLCLVSCVLC